MLYINGVYLILTIFMHQGLDYIYFQQLIL